MKRIIQIFTAVVLLSACTPDTDGLLGKLETEKDSLIAVNKEISARIGEIDKQIIELDSTYYDRLSLVTYMEIKEEDFAHYFNIHGVVESDKTSILLPESAGIIKKLKVKEGDRVKAGQTLAQLDAAMINSQIAELQTSYELAKTLFEKQDRLWKQNIGSEMEYLQAKNRKEGLESAMNSAQTQLRMASVKAPYGGVIDEVFVRVGEMANPMQPMFRIVNNGIVYVTSEVSENHIKDVNVRTPVEVVFSSLGDTIQAEISEVGEFINPENRSFKVKVNLDQSNDKYLPNLLASMKVRDYVSENTIVLRSALIQQASDGSDFIYLLKKEGDKYKAEKRMITTGKEYQGYSEILSGLEAGDLVINEGARSVRNGQDIRIDDEKK